MTGRTWFSTLKQDLRSNRLPQAGLVIVGAMMIMAISARGTILRPSSTAPLPPRANQVGAPCPTTFPKNAPSNSISPNPRATTTIAGLIFKPMPMKKKGLKNS